MIAEVNQQSRYILIRITEVITKVSSFLNFRLPSLILLKRPFALYRCTVLIHVPLTHLRMMLVI